MSPNARNGIVGVVVAIVLGAAAGWYVTRPATLQGGTDAVLADAASTGPSPRSDHPNVLVILWDTTRADHLNVYGYDKQTTPNMAEWSKKGVVFEQAISPAMWTVPSHASLFTGVMSKTHNADLDYKWLDGCNVTLAEWLGQNGYDTYAFSANPNLADNRFNLLQGVDTVDMAWKGAWKQQVAQATRKKLIARDRSTEISPAFPGRTNGAFYYNAAPFTGEALTSWLDARPDPGKPWYAYLNYMEAHKPRVPSLEARKRVADSPGSIELGLSTDLSLDNQLLYSVGAKDYTPAELDAIDDVYDAALTELDDWTGKLLDDLRQRGQLENTIVIFTSDHGENLGDHHLFGHRHGLYQALVHVPLVIAWEGHLEPRRVTEPTANVDLYYTITKLAGFPPPEGPQPGYRDDLLSGTVAAIFSEAIAIDREGIELVRKMGADPGRFQHTFDTIVQAGWKLIEDESGRKELYNLAIDPDELTDLAPKEPGKVAELDAALAAWEKTEPPYDPSCKVAGEGPREDDEATKEQLRLLGYVEGEAPPEAPAPGAPSTAPAPAAAGAADACAGFEGDELAKCAAQYAKCDASDKAQACRDYVKSKAQRILQRRGGKAP